MDEAHRLLTTAEAYQQAGNLDAAIRHTRSALEIDPENTIALMFLGRLYLQDGKVALLQQVAKDLVALAPEYDAAHHLTAECRLLEGKASMAVESARKAVSIAPYNPLNHVTLGRVLASLKRYGQAEAAFKAALEQDPAYTYGKVHYARFLFEQNRIKDAKVLVQEATSEDPENASLALLRGESALVEGDTAEAISNALWILGRHADSHEALWLLVRAKARRHPILGILWRFVLWMGHLKSYQQTLIAIVLFYVGVVSGLLVVWIALLVVYFISLYFMRRMVKRELQSVHVKPF